MKLDSTLKVDGRTDEDFDRERFEELKILEQKSIQLILHHNQRIVNQSLEKTNVIEGLENGEQADIQVQTNFKISKSKPTKSTETKDSS